MMNLSQTIQWFPGHMAKARREATERIQMVDVVIELVDARIPESSRNPIVQEIIGQKPSVIVLNKMDLANPQDTRRWIEIYQEQGMHAMAIDAQHNKGINTLKKLLQDIMKPVHEEQRKKGVRPRDIRLMILGIPNVGKSTLINRFVGKNQAITGNKPGVTKAQRWLKVGQQFSLLDTPGILWPKFEDPDVGKKLAITGAIKDQLLHMDDLALYLLDRLSAANPGALSRYSVSQSDIDSLSTVDLLLLITEKMGLREDYDEASFRIIHDFRNHRLGSLTLDLPYESASYEG